MKKLTNQIVWGCTIIGIAVGFIDIYIGEHILTHEGAGKGIMAIATGVFVVFFVLIELQSFKRILIKNLNN